MVTIRYKYLLGYINCCKHVISQSVLLVFSFCFYKLCAVLSSPIYQPFGLLQYLCVARMHAILQWGPFSPCRSSYCRILVDPDFYSSRNIVNHQTGGNSAPGPQLLMLQTGLGWRPGWLHSLSKLKLMAVTGRNWYNKFFYWSMQWLLYIWCDAADHNG